MNVYEIIERVHNPEKSDDDHVVYDKVNLYVLGRDLGDALSQVEDASVVVGVYEVCPVSELPSSKYRVVPVDEVVEVPFDTPPMHVLDDLEEVLEGVKNELVREQGYDKAVRVRDALALVRRMRMKLRTESDGYEPPHPMLCFEHGGSRACEDYNREYGFECPGCAEARTESLDPEDVDIEEHAKKIILEFSRSRDGQSFSLNEVEHALNEEQLSLHPLKIEHMLNDLCDRGMLNWCGGFWTCVEDL